MPASMRHPGRVITFYSYKGGTGRSMALANIAWILACKGKRVLVIDWDLEAPGLHRYFRPFLLDPELCSSDGLIDLIDRYATAAIRPVAEDETPSADWYQEYADFSDYVLGLDFEHFPRGGKIDLLPAGRQSDAYAVKVSSINWQNLYDRLGGGAFFEAVKAKARVDYDYILIDSRTGVSDTAGICTVQMPDSLVVCFTYNNQSIEGAAAVARSSLATHAHLAAERRSRQPPRATAPDSGAMADTPRPYLVFPVPMRVDAGESERLALRQSFARQSFAELVTHIDPSQVAEYWSGVEVPHRVFYAYEEVLAPFKDDPLDPKTVLAAFLRLASHLTDGEVTDYRLPITPELRQRFLSAFAQTTQTAHIRQEQVEAQRETLDQTLVRQADGVMFALPEGEKAMAQQLFCRLVRLGREEEGRGYFPIRFPLGELAEAELAVIDQLVRGGLVTIASASSGYQSVGFSDPRLPALWASLRGWLESDREYLLWRQQLRTYLADWDRSGNDKGAFLSGTLLAEARLWLRQREKDLTSVERAYIAASEQNAAQAQAPAVAPLPLPSFETARGGADQMDRWLTAKARTAAEGVAPAKAAAPSRPLRADVAAMAISTLAIDGDSPAKVASAFAARSSAIRVVIAIAFAFAFGSWWWLAARAHAPQIVAPQPSSSVSIALPVSSSEVSTAQKQQADEQIALGDQALTSGDVELAASRYQRALEIDSSRPEAALKLGRANEAKGDLNGAASAYERAMMIAPTSSTPWIERGATRALQGRYAEALADCSRAIELDKTVPRAWFNRGVAHENLNQPEAAIEDYSSAIALKPDVAALLARARLTESSHRAQALADYQSVLGLAPNAADAQLATERIRLLSPKALANAGPRIFVQYSSASDLSRVNDLRSALSGAFKLTVGPAQLAASGTSGSVRYFFASDEELANKVLATSQLALAKQGARVELKLMRLDAKNFPSAEAGTVELWLPSLSTPQPSRPDFIQRAPVKDLSENPY